MRVTYKYELIFFAVLSLCGMVAGYISEHYLLSLTISCLIYTGWHLYQIFKLYILVYRRRRLRQPYPPGLWLEIYRFIARYQQRSRKRKRNLTRFVARFRNTAINLPDALVILDNKLTVIWANAAAYQLLGFSWPEAARQPIANLLTNVAVLDYIRHGTFNRPLEIIPKHNNALVLSVRITPFGSKKRQKLLIARDITQLHHLNQIRKDFVANVSHELRTPLTVINGYVENLLDAGLITENVRHPLQRIHIQITRMTTLIQGLLTLSQLETGEKPIQHHPINIPEMLNYIILEANTLSTEHIIETDIDVNLWLMGNENEIRSAVSNLVFNAIKHTKAGTTVYINWHCNQTGPIFSVRDTGVGIAAEHIPRLTERFYRVDKSRSHANGSTGLGLAIVKHILTRHSADLHISSNLGEGSVFSCQFPKELVFLNNKNYLFL